jgi:hypothetical protein
MNDTSKRSLWTRLHHGALACVMLFCVSGCATTDLEYSQKIATARTDCTGKEIIGVWVSQLNKSSRLLIKAVLLVRPDGTGILRINREEWPMSWTYAGSGLWQGSATTPLSHTTVALVFRYNGPDLLLQYHAVAPFPELNCLVFVQADDAATVEEHLSKRR